MEETTTEFGTRLRIHQIASGQWEAQLDGIRCCLAPTRSIARSVAKGLDRHRAERGEGHGLDFAKLGAPVVYEARRS